LWLLVAVVVVLPQGAVVAALVDLELVLVSLLLRELPILSLLVLAALR
jgi:hypothetical protein